jgi:hypothetical protein
MKKIKPLTQAGIFAGIHVVLLILSNALVGLDFLLILALPFASSLYAIKNKPVNTLIFALSTLLICLPIDIIKTLLYILPGLVSGICYGYMFKFKVSNLTLIYTLSFVSSLLFILSYLIINLIYQIDFIELSKSFFNISDVVFHNYGPSLILIIGLCQSILTHIIIKEELTHMSIKVSNDYKPTKIWYFVSISCLVLSFIFFSIHDLTIAIYLMIVYLITYIPIVIEGYKSVKKHTIYIAIQCAIILFVIIPLLNVMVLDSIILLFSFIFIPYYLISYYNMLTKLSNNVVK